MTVRDAAVHSVMAGNFGSTQITGLRSGRAWSEENGLRLKNYELVPGVRVSGICGAQGCRLTIGGKGVANGTISTGNGELTGTLDGRKVRGRLQ
jgi:hypothetical protein